MRAEGGQKGVRTDWQRFTVNDRMTVNTSYNMTIKSFNNVGKLRALADMSVTSDFPQMHVNIEYECPLFSLLLLQGNWKKLGCTAGTCFINGYDSILGL